MTDPREAVQAPAISGRCSNHSPDQPKETPYDWAYLLTCGRCGAQGGEGWSLVSQQSHCGRILESNERLIRKGGWCYVYAHYCGRRADLKIVPGVEIEIPPAGVAALSELARQTENEQKRERLMTSLLFAARNLADAQLRARHTIHGSSIFCGECQAEVESNPLRSAHNHHRTCNTGLVLVLLSELGRLATPARLGGVA